MLRTDKRFSSQILLLFSCLTKLHVMTNKAPELMTPIVALNALSAWLS